ncbi:hypothetical protein BGZ82_002303 [Podila clonocystis]|nr:hypothetical protein BGZ82_002303 [Podila clonocystis]
MHKSLVLLVAVYSSVAVAVTNHVYIYNNDKSKSQVFGAVDTRFCACVKNTQTGFIKGVNGGDIKLFSTSDCTGNYQTLGSNSEAKNTQWVNSFSYGKSGIASRGPDGYCPDYYSFGQN